MLLGRVLVSTPAADDFAPQIDAIAKTDVDTLFIGPFDLGNNIGHPILNGKMDDELTEAITTIQRSAKEHKKSTGIYCTSGDQARQFADQGFHMVCQVTDPSEYS